MYLRKGNLKFTVTQDNIEKKLIIDDLVKIIDDRRGGDYFGFGQNDLLGQDIRKILPFEISEILDDNIEYNLEGNDLKTVMEKIINFKILDSTKKELNMNAYVDRALSTPEKLAFSIILERKIFLAEKIKSILAGIAEFQQVTHDATGLLNASAYFEVLNEVMDFLYDAKVEAVMCVISVEGFPMIRMNEGKEKVNEVLEKIGRTIRANFRGRDIMGYLGFGKFGIFMVRTFEDEVVYPLRRLESSLRKEGILTSKITYNARYQKVDMEMSVNDLVDQVKAKSVDYTLAPVR